MQTETNPDLIQMEPSWKNQLLGEFSKAYMKNLKQFLVDEREKKKNIFPNAKLFFQAFESTPFKKVKVVILGQDPYHGPNQAHGLCFSVQDGVPFPPSLQNIFKELQSDLGFLPPKTGNLKKWSEQGVLLLNSVLSVEAGKAASHAGRGWELFTDQVIEVLNQKREHIVFVLWGSYAQKKGAKIDRSRHMVIESPHPSPLSSYRGFFGSRPFSRINKYLKSHGILEIQWNLND